MVLQLNDFAGADQPSLRYIGKALREFRDSGKPIFAIGDSYNQTQYYLASYANKVYLSPQGAVDLHGFATNNLYYKSLLDMLKVTTNIFRVGTYKSAVEPLIRDDMSPAAREADSRWIGGLWQNYLETVAANRQLTPQQLFPGAAGVLSGLQAAGGDTPAMRWTISWWTSWRRAPRSKISWSKPSAGTNRRTISTPSASTTISRNQTRTRAARSPWYSPTAPSWMARKRRAMSG
jgi:Peptidase family S49.